MRVLLDENLPQRLRLLIPGHDVHTVAYQGWSSLLNGALLTAAEEAGFEVFVTADQSIRYQQNLTGRLIALVVLSTNQVSLLIRNTAGYHRGDQCVYCRLHHLGRYQLYTS